MKNYLFFIFICCINISFGQGFSFLFKSLYTPTGVNLKYDETKRKLVVDTFKLDIGIYQAITFTNSTGELLGYFNGHQVRNADGSLSINGDSLAWTQSLDWSIKRDENGKGAGLGCLENAVIIPTKDDSLYLLFYFDLMLLDDIDNFFLPYMLEAEEHEFTWYSKALLLSHVRVRSDGKLEILKGKKDLPVVEDFLMYRNLMAVPHANGKDFWIIAPCQHENTAYSILISDTTVSIRGKHFFSENNTKYLWPRYGTSKFSSLGDRLLRYNRRYVRSEAYPSGFLPHVLETMDFDRCEGRVIGHSTTDLLDVPWFGTAEFSPSGKYLYIGGIYFLARCELNKNSYFDQLDTIYKIPYENLSNIDILDNYDHSETMNLMPNGQIVCHSYWSTPYFHIVANPDADDINDIKYMSRAIILPKSPDGLGDNLKVGGMPRHVNLKMAVISCSTDVTYEEYKHNIQVYPNPVKNILNFSGTEALSLTGLQYEIIQLVSGQVILSGFSDSNSLNVEELKPGFYGLKINEKIIKFIKL